MDQVPVCGLEDTVHSRKEVFLFLPVRDWPGCDRMVTEKRGERLLRTGSKKVVLVNPVHMVVVRVR